MNINGNELRKGDVIFHENKIYQCMTAVHRTPGNLRAFIQAVLRNVRDGTQKEFRFSSTERLEKIDLVAREMQYLYNDGDMFHFMDTKNFEQIELSRTMISDKEAYLTPDMLVEITFQETTPISIQLPKTLEFEIAECDPEIKGGTATASYKKAKLTNGLMVEVPQFVKIGDRVRINTETDEYLERVKQ